MNILLSQVYQSRHPSSPLQRPFDNPLLLHKSAGNRKFRLKVRSLLRRLGDQFNPEMVGA